MTMSAKEIKEWEAEICLAKEVKECEREERERLEKVQFLSMPDPPGTTRLEMIANLLAK